MDPWPPPINPTASEALMMFNVMYTHLKILQGSCLSTLSSSQDHPGVGLVWSRCKMERSRYIFLWYTMLWQCWSIVNWNKWKIPKERGTLVSSLHWLLWKFNSRSQCVHSSFILVEYVQVLSQLFISLSSQQVNNTLSFCNYKHYQVQVLQIPPRNLLARCECGYQKSIISVYQEHNDIIVDRIGWWKVINLFIKASDDEMVQ